MATTREQYVRNAARFLVDNLNADRLEDADCTISAIESALGAPFFTNLAKSTQYDLAGLLPNQRRSLAKAIASAVANHPNRVDRVQSGMDTLRQLMF